MVNRRVRPILVVVTLVALLSVASMASANPSAPGTPTLRWVATGNPAVAEIRADGITDGGVQGNGAIAWDVYFRMPNSVPQPYPVITITPGPLFVAQSPCTFGTAVSANMPNEPGGTGDRGYYIAGFCTTAIPNNPVTGNDVLVATVNFTGCPAQGFIMDLSSGVEVFGDPVSDMIDRNNDSYFFTDDDLTDGPACGAPTAVSLANIETETSSSTATYGLLLALAALAAIVVGASVVLRRRSAAKN